MDVRDAAVADYDVALEKAQADDDVPPGYRRTDVGVIPEDWTIHAIGFICDVVAAGDLVKSEFSRLPDSQHPYPVFANALAARGLYGYSRTAGFKANCVTVTARGDIGHAAWRGSDFCAIGRLLVLSPRRPVVMRLVAECINHVVKFALESTGVPQLTSPQIARYKLALPPTLAEQQSIAGALSNADALIDSLQQLIAKKRALKQGAMQDLLMGRQRLPGFTGEWHEVTFGDIAGVRPDRMNPRTSPVCDFCVELEHIASGAGQLSGNAATNAESSLKAIFQTGDVLFGKLRAYLRKYWHASRAGVCSTEIWCLFPKGMLHSSTFLFHIVQTEAFIEAASMAYGTHMPRSDWKAVRTHSLCLPIDPEEQTAIATVLSDMDAEIEALEARLAKTRALKAGMMQQLLTGRIRLA